MSKAVIEGELLEEIIQKCVERRLNEAIDEGLMNTLGKAAGWAGTKLKQGANWVGKQFRDFRDGYNVGSSNANQSQNMNANNGTQFQDNDGPQPFPGLTAQGGGSQDKPQKEYTPQEVNDMYKQMMAFINQKKKEGYKYTPVKLKNGKTVNRFTAGPDPNNTDKRELGKLNATVTRLTNKWRIAAGYGKRMNEIIQLITKDVINEIRKLQ